MANYKKMYHEMFRATTDAVRLVEKVAAILKAAQLECEERYLEADETPLSLADTEDSRRE